jgi:hypothetical protein
MRLFFTFVLLIAHSAFAFDFKSLSAGISLTEVKKSYPYAYLEIISTPPIFRTHQYFSLRNTQHDGELILIFLNGYLINQLTISELEQKLVVAPEAHHPELIKGIKSLKGTTSRPFQDQLILSSFIWKPSTFIPLHKVLNRFGEPDDTRFESSKSIAILRWKKKGIDAHTTAGGGISYIEFWSPRPFAETIKDYLTQ